MNNQSENKECSKQRTSFKNSKSLLSSRHQSNYSDKSYYHQLTRVSSQRIDNKDKSQNNKLTNILDNDEIINLKKEIKIIKEQNSMLLEIEEQFWLVLDEKEDLENKYNNLLRQSNNNTMNTYNNNKIQNNNNSDKSKDNSDKPKDNSLANEEYMLMKGALDDCLQLLLSKYNKDIYKLEHHNLASLFINQFISKSREDKTLPDKILKSDILIYKDKLGQAQDLISLQLTRNEISELKIELKEMNLSRDATLLEVQQYQEEIDQLSCKHNTIQEKYKESLNRETKHKLQITTLTQQLQDANNQIQLYNNNKSNNQLLYMREKDNLIKDLDQIKYKFDNRNK